MISDPESCSNSQDSFLSQESRPQKTADDKKELFFEIIQTNNRDLVAKALNCKGSYAYKKEALAYSAQAGLAGSFRELVKNMFNFRKVKLQIDLLDLHTLGKAFLAAIPKNSVTTPEENEQRFQIMKDFSMFVLDVIDDHKNAAAYFAKSEAQQTKFYEEFRALVLNYVESGVAQTAANNQSYLLKQFLNQLSMNNTLQVQTDYFTSIALRAALENCRLSIAIELLCNKQNSFSTSVLKYAFYLSIGTIDKPEFADLLEVLITNDFLSFDNRGFALRKIIESTLKLKADGTMKTVKEDIRLATLLLQKGCDPYYLEKAMNLIEKSTWHEMETILTPYWKAVSNSKEDKPPPQGYLSGFENYFSWLRSYLPL